MDTSKEYILMCEKAQEIQELRLEDGVKVLKEFDFYKDSENSSLDCLHFSAPYYNEEDCIWLPRQDQLQEMIFHPVIKSLEVSKLFEFNNFIMLNNNWIKFSSMEQLWLAFVMREKYNKIWNTETENWELIE